MMTTISEQQQFVLRWHYHEITLLRNLPCFLDTDILTDVTLSVGSHSIKAHKLVLAMCSAYFFQLFQDMGSIQHPVIILHNVAIDDIKAILSFIYRGQCIVSHGQLSGLLSVAKLLKIQGLCDMKVPDSNSNYYDENDLNDKNNENFNPQQLKTQNRTIIENNTIATSSNTTNTTSNYCWGEEKSKNAAVPATTTVSRKSTPSTTTTTTKDASETCKCFLCGKYLSNQYNLRVHMETHEEAYHACQSCPHVSRSRDALRKHVSYRHPEEYHTRKRKKIIGSDDSIINVPMN